MLIAREVTKEYMSGEQKIAVLRDVSFTIPQGAFVAIVGPSGSGKTTLLGLLAGLDTPTRGTVLLDNSDLGKLTENERARLRGEKVGFVFQSFQLIPTLTALENVQVPLELRGSPGADEIIHVERYEQECVLLLAPAPGASSPLRVAGDLLATILGDDTGSRF